MNAEIRKILNNRIKKIKKKSDFLHFLNYIYFKSSTIEEF